MVDEVTIEDLLDGEEITYPDTGIIPDSFYEYFGKDIPQTLEEYLPDLQTIREDGSGDLMDVDTAVETTDIPPDDRKVISLTEDGSPVYEGDLNPDHFINNLIPFQEGDFSNTLMTDYIFPRIDKSYDAISNIGTEDLKDAGMDLLRMIPNTAINIPETYRDILTLPFQGARDIAQGDYVGAVMNPVLAADPSNSLFNYSDNPVSSGIGKAGEYLGGLFGAKKIQDAIMQAKKTPNWLKSFFRQGYPHFTRSSAKNLESILPSFKNFKKRAFGNTLSALRGAGQYGLASGILSLPLAATAYAMTPTEMGDAQLFDENESLRRNILYERVNNTGTFALRGSDINNPNEMRYAQSNVDQGPGPRDNYRGL